VDLELERVKHLLKESVNLKLGCFNLRAISYSRRQQIEKISVAF